jgi:hypothetical protein
LGRHPIVIFRDYLHFYRDTVLSLDVSLFYISRVLEMEVEEFRETLPKEFYITSHWNDEDIGIELEKLGVDWNEENYELVDKIAEAISDVFYEVTFYCEMTKDFKVTVKRVSVFEP